MDTERSTMLYHRMLDFTDISCAIQCRALDPLKQINPSRQTVLCASQTTTTQMMHKVNSCDVKHISLCPIYNQVCIAVLANYLWQQFGVPTSQHLMCQVLRWSGAEPILLQSCLTQLSLSSEPSASLVSERQPPTT